jgi:hypothetical protein
MYGKAILCLAVVGCSFAVGLGLGSGMSSSWVGSGDLDNARAVAATWEARERDGLRLSLAGAKADSERLAHGISGVASRGGGLAESAGVMAGRGRQIVVRIDGIETGLRGAIELTDRLIAAREPAN